MSIILESENDCVQNKSLNYKVWKQIYEILSCDTEINMQILEYQACEDDEIENFFYIIPLIRKKERL